MNRYLARIFAGELDKKKTDIPKDYLLNHMICDFAETVRWWMNHPEYSPEDISGFFLSTTPGIFFLTHQTDVQEGYTFPFYRLY